MQVLAAVYSCGSETVKAAIESEIRPVLPAGSSIQSWAGGLADKELRKSAKSANGKASEKGKTT